MEKSDKNIMKKAMAQPVATVKWLRPEDLTPNNYNPNSVAPTELELLKTSIKENGWTQPIVANPDMEIVDGFHRWTVSQHPDIAELTNGLIPVVITAPKDKATQMMATVRHNRARGSHAVLKMSGIVKTLLDEGLTGEEICERLGMETEEVTRLLYSMGIPKSDVFKDREFGKAWIPDQKQ